MADQDTHVAPAASEAGEAGPGGEGGEAWYTAENSTFGDRLAGAREAAGMTRGELARRMGLKVTTIEKWEDDRSEPRANRLATLSRLLGVSLRWLLDAEGEGIDAPSPEEGRAALLHDLRQIRADLQRSAERLGVLEKRVRQIVQGEP